jgi:hypothetical protein
VRTARAASAALLWALARALAADAQPAPAPAPEASAPAPVSYEVLYDVRLVPSERAAHVRIVLGRGAQHVRSIRLQVDPERHFDMQADGSLSVAPESLEWRPAGPGSSLRYVFRIDHLKDERSYDARFAKRWALFRGDDLVPPARVRTEKGAQADARLALHLPEGWSAVTPYPRRTDGSFSIVNPSRRFDRPTGWILVGRLGVVRERVAGVHLAIAAPVGQRFHRLDLLALLRWTLPSLRDAMGTLPERILVVGANDPMWRGGLSAPRSLYLHSARPLIESDGTSPVLHELVHSVLGIRGAPGDDWIVEGLAEYYSLEILVRSHTISRRRHDKSLARLAEHGRRARTLVSSHASGEITARAVGVLADLDREIRKASDDQRDLDDVLGVFAAERGEVSTARLREVAERFTDGKSLAAFFRRRVPGAPAPPRPR